MKQNKVTVGRCLGFVSPSTRTEGPHGAHVQMSKRNRLDSHSWGFETALRLCGSAQAVLLSNLTATTNY